MKGKSFIKKIFGFLLGGKGSSKDTVTHNRKMKKEQASSTVERVDSEDEEGTPSDKSQSDACSEDFAPKKVMKALGVEVFDQGEDEVYWVGFQGSTFVFCFEDNRLNVIFNDVVECSFVDSVRASLVANNINSNYSVWSAYLRVEKSEEDDKPVKVCFSQMFSLIGNFNETVKLIHLVMMSVFSIARQFKEELKESLSENSDLMQVMNHKDFIHKLEYTKRLMEVGRWDSYTEEEPSVQFLKIHSLISLFDDSVFGNTLLMKIYALNDVTCIDNPQEIEDFDIREFIRNHPDRDKLENISVVVTFEKQDLVIHLKKMPGSSNRTLFYMLSVMRSGSDVDLFSRNQSTVSCRATIEVRLTSDKDDYWEAKYMIGDALEKQVKNDISSLTAEQKTLLIQMNPNIQDDLYWGIKYFNQSCWFQALFYFKRIFHNLVNENDNPKKSESLIADICFYLGVTFFHLKMYDRAYYYLDRARQGTTLAPSEWFAECLCRMKDPLASVYLNNLIETFIKQFGDLEPGERYYDYLLFMKRRLVEAYINEGKLKWAERYLYSMLAKNECDSFVRNSLRCIQELREKMKNKGEQEKRTENHE